MVDGLGLVRRLGFGHSCGGAALLLAEQARPGTFRDLYLYEPVVMPFHEIDALVGATIRCRKGRGAGVTRSPRPSDAFVNFSSKPPFGDLDPDVLRRYVEDGFEPVPADEGGDGVAIRLRCRREDEARGLPPRDLERRHSTACTRCSAR